MNPVCECCAVEMRCAKNGVQLKVGAFTFIRCDRMECPRCHESVLVNFGRPVREASPIDEIVELHYHEGD